MTKSPDVHSAVKPEDYPNDSFPEVAIVGRSNAGKSSMINAIMGKKIAFVSQKPGKTITLNFFSGKSYRLVDMPGYGYA
ncbi:MAG: 50S ribosome-binding GTPase, partial [Bdellovibrionales bacterium]|nr:50S ribosome-binding GTPase [Bdellovibrionales bacterium]